MARRKTVMHGLPVMLTDDWDDGGVWGAARAARCDLIAVVKDLLAEPVAPLMSWKACPTHGFDDEVRS